MTSKKQIKANRKNAKRSTGPSTDEGKVIVARNATRHGILSAQLPIDDDEKQLYAGFLEAMQRELGARGDLQAFLVDRIISTAWRLRRVVQVETLMFQRAQNALYSQSIQDAFQGRSAGDMAVLSRYERSLENALFRALKEFRALKDEDELEVFSLSV